MTSVRYHTTAEVAAIFRCAPDTVYKLARQFGIGIKLGRTNGGWRFSDDDLTALDEALRVEKESA